MIEGLSDISIPLMCLLFIEACYLISFDALVRSHAAILMV